MSDVEIVVEKNEKTVTYKSFSSDSGTVEVTEVISGDIKRNPKKPYFDTLNTGDALDFINKQAKAGCGFSIAGMLFGPVFSLAGIILGADCLSKEKNLKLISENHRLAVADIIVGSIFLPVWIFIGAFFFSDGYYEEFFEDLFYQPPIENVINNESKTEKKTDPSKWTYEQREEYINNYSYEKDGLYNCRADSMSPVDELNYLRQDAINLIEEYYNASGHYKETYKGEYHLNHYEREYNGVNTVSLNDYRNLLDTGDIDFEIELYPSAEEAAKDNRAALQEEHKYRLQNREEYYKPGNIKGYYDEELNYSIWTMSNFDDNNYDNTQDSFIYYFCQDGQYIYDIDASYDVESDYEKMQQFLTDYCSQHDLPVPDFERLAGK
ncbi:MAG: DUF4190 domain-containing protein [Pseudobutyrivibrio sp.]|nr:DUF4190 domain-containing protein [Pseudobutyrivibrio sp.]